MNIDLRLVVHYILSDLLKTNDNLFFIILVIIFFTELVELTLFICCPLQEMRMLRGLVGGQSDGPS